MECEKNEFIKYIILQSSYPITKQQRDFYVNSWDSLSSEETTARSVRTGSWIFVLMTYTELEIFAEENLRSV